MKNGNVDYGNVDYILRKILIQNKDFANNFKFLIILYFTNIKGIYTCELFIFKYVSVSRSNGNVDYILK